MRAQLRWHGWAPPRLPPLAPATLLKPSALVAERLAEAPGRVTQSLEAVGQGGGSSSSSSDARVQAQTEALRHAFTGFCDEILEKFDALDGALCYNQVAHSDLATQVAVLSDAHEEQTSTLLDVESRLAACDRWFGDAEVEGAVEGSDIVAGWAEA